MKDRDGKEVSVYAINYGLCQQETINFGRPREKREQRLYYVERIFDYSPIIKTYLSMNQEIVCDECGAKHEASDLPMLEKYGMLCPDCKKGQCKVVNLSKKYGDLIQKVSEDSLLPKTELGCSYQLIGKRGKNLSERELVERDENDKGRRVFKISKEAEELYFTNNSENDNFDFDEPEEQD